jgi:predicted NAD/FAD-binding protein
MRDFPVRHFARFFQNHGLLQLTNRPAWRTVDGGSRRYVEAVLAQLPDVRLSRSVRGLSRDAEGVTIHAEGGPDERFDAAVLACHADHGLALLDQPTWAEQQILGKFRCQDNLAVLHTDASLMPKRKAVWSAWNYLSNGKHDHAQEVSVTYWMNKLQSLDTALPLLVSLNPLHAPDPRSVLLTRQYRHPLFDAAAMQAQSELASIQGADRLYFAGAWTGWGFHEDGIASAVRIARLLGITPPWDTASRVET